MKPDLMVVTLDEIRYYDNWDEAMGWAHCLNGYVVSYASLDMLQKCGSFAQWQIVRISKEYIENPKLPIGPLGL